MNWVEEKERIQKILDEMSISEFEQMLIKRGVEVIKESDKSSYVKCSINKCLIKEKDDI